MATQAQDVIYCDSCSTAAAEVHCDSCQVKMCRPCSGHHVSNSHSRKHEIVPYTSRKIKHKEAKCDLHSGQICELHCEDCNIPICSKCVLSKLHNQHEIKELSEYFDGKKRDLIKDTSFMENEIMQHYDSALSKMKEEAEELSRSHEMLEVGIQEQGKRLHQEVDVAIKRELSLARNMKSEDMAAMKDSVSHMEDLRSSLQQEIERNKKIVKSGDYSKIVSFRSAVDKFKFMPPRPALSKPVFKASEIKKKTIRQQVGEIQSSPKSETPGYQIREDQGKRTALLKEAGVVTEVDTEFEELWRIAFLHPGQLWCSGDDSSVKKIDLKGSVLQVLVVSCEFHPQDISVSPEGALFYTDVDSHSVYIVRKKERNELSLKLSGWKPWSICACSMENILVALKNDSYTEAKVVRYVKSKEKQTIQFDDNGQALYSPERSLMFVAENQNNKDIIVSDKAWKQLVVVNKSGKFRFRYPEGKSFVPRCVTTDTGGRILVTDGENNRIHIIDADGKFISYIDNWSLNVPVSLTIDNDNTLWVGEFYSGKIKGIRYLQ